MPTLTRDEQAMVARQLAKLWPDAAFSSDEVRILVGLCAPYSLNDVVRALDDAKRHSRFPKPQPTQIKAALACYKPAPLSHNLPPSIDRVRAEHQVIARDWAESVPGVKPTVEARRMRMALQHLGMTRQEAEAEVGVVYGDML